MDWSFIRGGVEIEDPKCLNYMTNRRRWTESIILVIIFITIMRWAVKRLDAIVVPSTKETEKPHSPIRLTLLLAMTLTFGIEMGFKFANRSVIFVMHPCHIQTLVQIYLLASKPNKITIALFRIQMNNLNGPFLACIFPEVECRTLPFEQATYWIQHVLLYIIPIYILRSGAYDIEPISDYNWVIIGVMNMLTYHFLVLNTAAIITGVNLNFMLCPASADPFQYLPGHNYRIAAVIHESILCPILNKATVLIFSRDVSKSKGDASLEVFRSNMHRLNQTDEVVPKRALYEQKGDQSLASDIVAGTKDLFNGDDCNIRHRVQESTISSPTSSSVEDLLLKKVTATAGGDSVMMSATKID